MKTITVTTEVDVDIDADYLHEHGWHHEDECDANNEELMTQLRDTITSRARTAAAVIVSLHRQAHPSQAAEVRLCREEPCRSLRLDHLREAGL